MNRITQLEPAASSGKTKQLLDSIQKQLGSVPNLMRVLANSPAALEGYLNLNSALAHGSLPAPLREQIALAVAETNQCAYCLSAHCYLGSKAGLSVQDMTDARQAKAGNAKADALLKLARGLILRRGEVDDSELQTARLAGASDGDLVELIAHVALNTLTNYVNHAARTVVDFPEIEQTHHNQATCSCA